MCLIRAAHHGPEVLMVRRSEGATFMGGAWVDTDAGPDAGSIVQSTEDGLGRWRAAALRELVEETGIWLTVDGDQVTDKRPGGAAIFGAAPSPLNGERLRYFANWITPAPLPIRFDTRFFVTEVTRHVEALVDGRELVDAAWTDPADALERADAGEWLIAFPTRSTLQVFAGHDSVIDLFAVLTDPGEVEAVQPRLVVGDDAVRILLPGDPDFDEAANGEDDPDLLARAMAVAEAGGTVPAEMRLA